jgi:hypothetical protein
LTPEPNQYIKEIETPKLRLISGPFIPITKVTCFFVVINKLYKARTADRHAKETKPEGKSEPRVLTLHGSLGHPSNRDVTNGRRLGRHSGRRIKIIDIIIKSIY